MAPHVAFLQAIHACLQDPVNSSEHDSKQAQTGDTGDVPMGRSMGSGLESQEPGGQACSALPARCPFCHWVSHDESVCEVKCASYLATHHAPSMLAQSDGIHYAASSTVQCHLQIALAVVSTDCPTSTQTPPNTVHSRSPEGDDPEGVYMHPMREATAAAPLGLFRGPVQVPSSYTSHWVAHLFRALLRGTPTPASTGLFSGVDLGGGSEGLVDPQGGTTNIPPPIPGGLATGHGLSLYRQYTPPGSLTLSSCAPTVVGDTSCVPQPLCPSTNGLGLPQASHTGLLHESPVPSHDGLQPLCCTQKKPGHHWPQRHWMNRGWEGQLKGAHSVLPNWLQSRHWKDQCSGRLSYHRRAHNRCQTSTGRY